MASPFGNLGLSELGSEAKYASNPETVPGFIQGAVAIPKAYMAQNWLKPAVNWIEKQMGVAPPIDPNVLAQQYEMYKNPYATFSMPTAASSTLAGASVDENADHPLLDGLTKSNPY